MAENKPYFTAPGWAPSTKQERQHRIDTANRNEILKDAAVITGASILSPLMGAPAIAGAAIGGAGGAGLLGWHTHQTMTTAGMNQSEQDKYWGSYGGSEGSKGSENDMADTGASLGERQAIDRRQEKETKSPEYKARRKLEQDAIAAANAEAAAKGVSTTQLKETAYYTNSLNLIKRIYENMTMDPPSSSAKKTKKIRKPNILDSEGKLMELEKIQGQEDPYDSTADGLMRANLMNIKHPTLRKMAMSRYETYKNKKTGARTAYNQVLTDLADFRDPNSRRYSPSFSGSGQSSRRYDVDVPEDLRHSEAWPAYVEIEVPDDTPDSLKEHVQNKTKTNIITSFMENAKFARRGPSSQRPKSWSKGTKAGSDKRKMREEGKREARGMNEASDPNKFFGTTPSGETRGLSRNWGVAHEDSPTFYQDQEIARINHNSQWAMKQLLPVFQKHGMDAEHSGRVDEYGFPTGAHAVSHPNFSAFVRDFIQFHTQKNQEHWRQHGRASRYHWPAILRGRRGLDALRQHQEFNAKQRTTPPVAPSTERGWPSREEQRTHAPHELGIPDDVDRYSDLSETRLHESEEEVGEELGNVESHPIELMLQRMRAIKMQQDAQRAAMENGSYPD